MKLKIRYFNRNDGDDFYDDAVEEENGDGDADEATSVMELCFGQI